MEIKRGKPEDFPTGRGGRIRKTIEFQSMLKDVLELEAGGEHLEIYGKNWKENSAANMRNALTAELKSRKKFKNFDVITRSNGLIHHLFVRRIA